MESIETKGTYFDMGCTAMALAAVRAGWQFVEPALPLVMGGASVLILVGCAVASWVCPNKKEDCLFRRHVM
jgi:hypothetical protein